MKKSQVKTYAIVIGIWAFLLAALAGFLTQTALKDIRFISLAFAMLLIVVFIGIIFDIIGVAATAARKSSLHAMASNKVFGAAQAVWLSKNASRTASFCNDVVGDVSGTLSGAISVTILFKILINPPEPVAIWSATLMTAFIAAITVSGKALGKTFAVEKGTDIIFRTGQCIAWMEKLSPMKILGKQN